MACIVIFTSLLPYVSYYVARRAETEQNVNYRSPYSSLTLKGVLLICHH